MDFISLTFCGISFNGILIDPTTCVTKAREECERAFARKQAAAKETLPFAAGQLGTANRGLLGAAKVPVESFLSRTEAGVQFQALLIGRLGIGKVAVQPERLGEVKPRHDPVGIFGDDFTQGRPGPFDIALDQHVEGRHEHRVAACELFDASPFQFSCDHGETRLELSPIGVDGDRSAHLLIARLEISRLITDLAPGLPQAG